MGSDYGVCDMAGRKWFLALVLVLAAFAPKGLCAEEAGKASEKMAEAEKVFGEVYGADIKRAKATSDTRDDVELAARLLKAAGEVSTAPEFVAVLCEKAYELATVSPDGFKTAVDAMELESSKFPDKADACYDRILEVRQKQFDLGRGNARVKAGEALIDVLMTAVEMRAASAPADALALCRRAQSVARLVNSEAKGVIDARMASLGQLTKIVREADGLKKQLESGPQNAAVREKLVRLCLVDMDNPAEAAIYVEGVSDEALRKYVPAAAKPIDSAPEMACMELGDWYRTLADSAPPAAKSAMLARAQGYYQRFLRLHEAADISRTKAAMILKNVEEEMKRVGSADVKAPLRLRIALVPELSMKPCAVKHTEGGFPIQETIDPLGPFDGKPVYFDQKTGKNVVYDVRSPKTVSQVYFKGAAMFKMAIEVQDPDGKTVAKGGPYGGGNTWGEFTVEFPPRRIFRLKFYNEASTWLFINTLIIK
jgi:hypothetical protein